MPESFKKEVFRNGTPFAKKVVMNDVSTYRWITLVAGILVALTILLTMYFTGMEALSFTDSADSTKISVQKTVLLEDYLRGAFLMLK